MTDETVAYMGWPLSAQEQIDGFRREVRELKAENALLWEQGALLFDKTLELGTENAKLREKLAASPQCETCEAMLDCDECLRADESAKERKRLDYENTKLRELFTEFWTWVDPPFGLDSGTFEQFMAIVEQARELGLEVD